MLNWFARRLAETGKEARKDQRGFTLIELLVVVIIIGILAAIAIPVFLSQRESAQDSAAQSDLRNLASAAQSYYADNDGSYASMDVATLAAPPYNWNNTDGVSMGTITATADSFSVTATSEAGNDFTFDSTTGTITP